MATGRVSNAVVAQKRVDYLSKLQEGESVVIAMDYSGLTYAMRKTARRDSQDFRNKESEYLGVRTQDALKSDYLYLLEKYCGNWRKAKQMANIRQGDFNEFRKQPRFLEAEAEVCARLVADAEENSMKIALGRQTKVKDSAHMRWMLSRLVPDKWGDKPREIEHKFSGSITVKNTAAQIMEILGGDVTDAELEQLGLE